MFKKTNTILMVVLVFLCISLFAAYFIEYIMGHKPCSLCLYQRIPYFFSIILILSIFFTEKYKKNIFIILSIISIIGAILGFYHFGIEKGIFDESFCKVISGQEEDNIKELIKNLKNSPISCKNVPFTIFGLSLATINTLFSLALFAIFTKLYFNYEKNG